MFFSGSQSCCLLQHVVNYYDMSITRIIMTSQLHWCAQDDLSWRFGRVWVSDPKGTSSQPAWFYAELLLKCTLGAKLITANYGEIRGSSLKKHVIMLNPSCLSRPLKHDSPGLWLQSLWASCSGCPRRTMPPPLGKHMQAAARRC
jgi:hypothetical protein